MTERFLLRCLYRGLPIGMLWTELFSQSLHCCGQKHSGAAFLKRGCSPIITKRGFTLVIILKCRLAPALSKMWWPKSEGRSWAQSQSLQEELWRFCSPSIARRKVLYGWTSCDGYHRNAAAGRPSPYRIAEVKKNVFCGRISVKKSFIYSFFSVQRGFLWQYECLAWSNKPTVRRAAKPRQHFWKRFAWTNLEIWGISTFTISWFDKQPKFLSHTENLTATWNISSGPQSIIFSRASSFQCTL